MSSKDSPIERLGAVLNKSLKRLDLGTRLDEYGVWPIWNDVVGTAVASNAQPEKIRHGTLFIKVSSPVWMQQLQYMKDVIAEKLNQRLGAELVKNIFFVVGKIEPLDTQDKNGAAPPLKDGTPQDVDAAFLDSISDPEIRQAFERMMKSFAKRKPKSD